RQKLATNSERKIQLPEAVKIGWDHQSGNDFAVHPSNRAFEAAPVKSPKWNFIQSIHAMLGIAAQATNAQDVGMALWTFPQRACSRYEHASTTIAKRIRGKLLSFVR